MPIPTGIATGVGSIVSKEVVRSIAANTRVVLPAGWHYIYLIGANIKLQVQDSTGTWQDLSAAGATIPGLVYSDGVNVGLFSTVAAGGGAQTATTNQVGIGG